jgi:hypothetical protein
MEAWCYIHWYFFLQFANMGTHFWTWTTFVSYNNRQIVFNNKIGHENSCSEIVLWNKGCCRSDKDLSLCVLVNICRFISASLWWAQLNSRERKTHIIKKFGWELEAFTGHLLHHLESNFVLHAAVPLNILGRFFAGMSAVECSRSNRNSVFSEPVMQF